MTKHEIINVLDGILDKEMNVLDFPSMSDWTQIEKNFNCKFPTEFIFFIELMSEYSFPGDILNVSSGKTNGNDTIQFTYDYEVKHGGWKEGLIPFYNIGNGDYVCLLSNECPDTGVYYYSHEDGIIKQDATTFEEWIKELPAFLS